MSQDAENKQCQICQGYLFEDDDVVVCPECGAPHHRDCWQSLGHCGVEADHGTDNEYSKRIQREREIKEDSAKDTSKRVCPACSRESEAKGDFCPYCGNAFSAQHEQREFNGRPDVFRELPFQLDPLGGVPKNEKIEDCKAGDVARFVGSNSHRYVPKFRQLNRENTNSWNWTAFLFPSVWCFARKMYLNGALLFLLSLASNLCFLSFNSSFNALFDTEGLTRSEIYKLIYANVDRISWIMIALALAGLLLNVIPRIIAGIKGDWMYRSFVLSKVKSIVSDPDVEELEEELSASGNLNLILMFVILLAEQYLPSIIATFIV
ncbi:MAG: DUF2628 domain-containing protein [Clostridia bacterium]|nr:DUF2628 domain-containing protein [Clostridia bacterium]